MKEILSADENNDQSELFDVGSVQVYACLFINDGTLLFPFWGVKALEQ